MRAKLGSLTAVTPRRLLALALMAGGLAAGIALGQATGTHTSTAAGSPCPLAEPAATVTSPCCGPPRAVPRAMTEPPPITIRCDPCGGYACTVPTVPTTPSPTPSAVPRLTIPKGGLAVRHGRFRVTCTMMGAVGECTVRVHRAGRRIGSGRRALVGGKARVTVKLVRAASASLARHRRFRARLTATAGGKHTTVTATLKSR
jgi:hypothetical protein